VATNPNFEVVCNVGESYCQQFTRYNNEPGYPWSSGSTAFSGGPITHVSMILSYPWGNLEAVVTTPGGGLQHWYRDPGDPSGIWYNGAGTQIDDVLENAGYGQSWRSA
jgi:hypothetical protein